MARILVVDDDDGFRAAISKILANAGYEVVEAADGKAAQRVFRQRPADLVLMDVYMPEADGIEASIRLRQEFPEVKIVVVSGGGYMDKVDVLQIATRLGARATLMKPVEREDVLHVVREALGEVS